MNNDLENFTTAAPYEPYATDSATMPVDVFDTSGKKNRGEKMFFET